MWGELYACPTCSFRLIFILAKGATVNAEGIVAVRIAVEEAAFLFAAGVFERDNVAVNVITARPVLGAQGGNVAACAATGPVVGECTVRVELKRVLRKGHYIAAHRRITTTADASVETV